MNTTEDSERLLGRVRKLLAKAEAEGVTPAEAEALTAKAAELMAKYGIDRALLAASRPETDRPGDRVVLVHKPWTRVQAHLLSGLASAMRCKSILLTSRQGQTTVHLFGYVSDLERTDLLYTSVLVQMWHALAATPVPARVSSVAAWRRSWLLGFSAAVISRVSDAEQRAAQSSAASEDGKQSRTALVLADRALVIRENAARAYPNTRATRLTYSGSGYGAGYSRGQRADIGGARLAAKPGRALTG
jgi:hypothetical protein